MFQWNEQTGNENPRFQMLGSEQRWQNSSLA
jgi:hypothetical protein